MFLVVGAVCILVIASDTPTLPFMPYFEKNPHGFFIGGAVYIWVISDFTSTFAFSCGRRGTAPAVDEVLQALLTRLHICELDFAFYEPKIH